MDFKLKDNMLAVITGDIVRSSDVPASKWMEVLRKCLTQIDNSKNSWQIYRGDEFQIKTSPNKALWTAIYIKSHIKTISGLDVRMGIGIGTENFSNDIVTQSNGPAYQRSGRIFETLKSSKCNMVIQSDDERIDRILNLMIKLALSFMDNWSSVSAETVAMYLNNSKTTQSDLADKIGIKQSAISQRINRAKLDLVLELIIVYELMYSTK